MNVEPITLPFFTEDEARELTRVLNESRSEVRKNGFKDCLTVGQLQNMSDERFKDRSAG